MADNRSVILNATKCADELHARYGLKEALSATPGRVDVFALLDDRGLPYLFRPLQGLLGAYLNRPVQGVLISTTRPLLAVQRFTAAHELGHAVMGHEPSLDSQGIIARSPFVAGTNLDQQELAANAFASELLMPHWLVVAHMKRQKWTANDLTQPEVVYQLSLRLGASYAATCHALARFGTLKAQAHTKLSDQSVKSIKRKVAGPVMPESWHGDFWHITDQDDGLTIEASVRDVLVFDLPEHASGGYKWHLEHTDGAGLELAEDWRDAPQGSVVGSSVARHIAVRVGERGRGRVRLTERRPWLPAEEPLRSVEVVCAVRGPIEQGLSESERQRILDAA